MQLGTILDGAKHKPAVTHPIQFKIGVENASAQKTSAEARAALVYVSAEEIEEITADADASIAKTLKDKPITAEARETERQVQFLAVALRDETDIARPFADGGAEQLRAVILPSVADWLLEEYRTFIKREYHPRPSDEDIASLKGEAAGK